MRCCSISPIGKGGKLTGSSLQKRKMAIDILNEKEIYTIQEDIDSSHPRVAYMAPTKLQARQIIWPYYKEFFSDFPGVHFNNNLLKLTVPRVHLGDEFTLELFASKNHDRIRGNKFRHIDADEVQDFAKGSIESSIRPTLMACKGTMNVFGTAKGQQNYLYELMKFAVENNQTAFFFPVNKSNVYSEEYINKLREESPDDALFRREYLLDFTADLPGTFFHKTLESLKREPWFYMSDTDESMTNVVGVDIGLGSGFGAWTAKVDPENNLLHIQDFYTGIDNLLDLKLSMEDDGFIPDVIFLPHDGNKRDIGVVKSDTPKKRFKLVFPDTLIRVNPRTGDLMADIAGVNENLHLLRFPDEDFQSDAHQGLTMLSEFSRKIDKNTGCYIDAVDKTRGVDHCADAMRTLFNGLGIRNGRIMKPVNFKIRKGFKKREFYLPRDSRFSNQGMSVDSGRFMGYGQGRL